MSKFRLGLVVMIGCFFIAGMHLNHVLFMMSKTHHVSIALALPCLGLLGCGFYCASKLWNKKISL